MRSRRGRPLLSQSGARRKTARSTGAERVAHEATYRTRDRLLKTAPTTTAGLAALFAAVAEPFYEFETCLGDDKAKGSLLVMRDAMLRMTATA